MNYLTSATCAAFVILLLMDFSVQPLSLCVSVVNIFYGVPPQRHRDTEVAQRRRIDYSQFSHRTHVDKEKPACDGCHKFPTENWKTVRDEDAAFPDVAEFPQHESCIECHRRQFFARERPAPAICSNCHVKVTPRDTARFLFPSLGDLANPGPPKPADISEFRIYFPHEKHADVVSPPDDQSNNCVVCHQTYQPQGNSDVEYVTQPPENLGDNYWLKKGSFKASPHSHAGCFTCHNEEAGIAPAPSECNVCHRFASPAVTSRTDFDPTLAQTMKVLDQTILVAWGRRISSGAYRHEGGEHPNIDCGKCHNTAAMITSDPKTFVVPVNSCGGADGCHVTATADDGGILNYEVDQKKASASFVCTKCHITLGKERLPESHLRAIEVVKTGRLPGMRRLDAALASIELYR